MDFHPVADIFPMIEGEDFDAFCQDIKENGQRTPVDTYEGRIIDGRNRYRANEALGRQTTFVEWDGKGSMVEYVISKNLHRRHLTTGQKAMLGAKIREALRVEADKRMRRGTKADPSLNLSEGKTSHQAAKVANTSPSTIEMGAKVLKTGIPELEAAVNAKQAAISTAAEIAKLPPDQQLIIVSAGPDAMLEAAQAARVERRTKPPATPKTSEPIAARGLQAVCEYLDGVVDQWAKDTSEHAEIVFAEMQRVRLDLCGR